MKLESVEAFRQWQAQLKEAFDPEAPFVSVCGTGCSPLGSSEVADAFEAEARKGGADHVRVKRTGCQGFCQQGPVVVVYPGRIFYPKVQPEHVPAIFERTALNGEPVEELLYRDPVSKEKMGREDEVPFYAAQRRVLLRFASELDPHDIEDYVVRDGYSALVKALHEMAPEEVVEEVVASGLRGRGGAGFPTGVKWRFCRQSPGDEKYLICNADEGDPGAFMDRSLLEGCPHAVIEGMLIAAHAIGASHGIVYVRAEYPMAVSTTQEALEAAGEAGLVGTNILGTGWNFDIELREGAGAFVCGEESALIASLEGERGMPRPRPPFPAERGYRGKPTNINNVETFANVPPIILRGQEWYSSTGTEGSKGTKIFALAGKVNNTGLIEVPMGVTLREIVFGVGGGVARGRHFKAAQTGGPSGGCVPAEHLDLPIDYDSLRDVGAIMGSGGLIVMDDTTCMVDVARFFLEFVQDESCGKCTPCRIGTKHMLEILRRITHGEGGAGDIEELERLGNMVQKTALCGLGQTGPNPVLSTIRHFREEYEQHIHENYCAAGVCPGLCTFVIDEEACKACQRCLKECPVDAIVGEPKVKHKIIQDKCIQCGRCREVCPFEAVNVLPAGALAEAQPA